MKIFKFLRYSLLIASFAICGGCSYLDIVPDGVATLEMAFNNKANAERYLSTCYSYIPEYGHQSTNPGIGSGNETWFYAMEGGYFSNKSTFGIARGLQNANSPLCNFWDGDNGGKSMFQAIRACNTMLENLSDRTRIPDLEIYERTRWTAEAKALKAYFHYYLLQLYGPIPIIDENLEINASPEAVRVKREKVDDVVNYIVTLLDEAIPDLPLNIQKETSELGRLTRPAAMGLKAKILLLAASPLFNGNNSYANFRDTDDQPFFNQAYSVEKWAMAADASKEAIKCALEAGVKLYDFNTEESMELPEPFCYTMNVRGAVTSRYNCELVWGIGKSATYDLQTLSMARTERWHTQMEPFVKSLLSATLSTAESFYTKNGVPMSEDKEWIESGQYVDRYSTRTATEEEGMYIKPGYTTAKLNFDREPRFYGSLGFDGSSWYGNGRREVDNMYYLEAKRGQLAGRRTISCYNITGYFPKKLLNYRSEVPETGSHIFEEYPFPIIRLADLYLMYAESLNEASSGNVPEDVYNSLDLIRRRSGLEGVRESWSKYSVYPDKPNTQSGMRDIIRMERGSELVLEANRYFDIRRWKLADTEFNKVIQGWNIEAESTEEYYTVTNIYQMHFSQKDYFWPIKHNNILVNSNLIQNVGW
ncbi:MAG: RagB/SusD family nutrient uptake outer membrane protein [Bacteroides sp.]|nr:RagB/SusD family nutrient uptake outer membrane protein [Bacteroides sp.]